MADELEARPLFFYGTLRDPDLLMLVLGRSALDGVEITEAALADHAVERVRGESFPMARPAPGVSSPGVLIHGLGPVERARIAFFEDSDYRLAPVEALVGGARRPAALFAPTEKLSSSGEPWRLEAWAAGEKPLLMACAEEQMSYFDRVGQSVVESWWPDIKARAEARLGLDASVRSRFVRSDVDERERREAYRHPICSVETMTARIPLFETGERAELERVVFRAPAAVTLLPYDPHRDEVVLVEQWRSGLWVSNAPNPWSIEVVAGMIDAGETAEQVARRESLEEAGLEIGRLEPIGAHYSSPGLSDQLFHSYVGEAHLAEAGGVHGLAEEGEDIRVLRLGFFEAMAALARGDVDNTPSMLSLYWLARNRERLRLLWR